MCVCIYIYIYMCVCVYPSLLFLFFSLSPNPFFLSFPCINFCFLLYFSPSIVASIFLRVIHPLLSVQIFIRISYHHQFFSFFRHNYPHLLLPFFFYSNSFFVFHPPPWFNSIRYALLDHLRHQDFELNSFWAAKANVQSKSRVLTCNLVVQPIKRFYSHVSEATACAVALFTEVMPLLQPTRQRNPIFFFFLLLFFSFFLYDNQVTSVSS